MIQSSLELIFQNVNELKKSKKVSLNGAINQILARDIFAVKNLPSFDNSALDGYAFNYDFVNKPLKIVGTIFAGDKSVYELSQNCAYRIMTGAMMPKASDTVVEFEKAVVENDMLFVDKSIKKHNAYRYAGEEVKAGEMLLRKGEVLTPDKIMLLASQGIDEVKVFTKPKVAVFSSGDEIVEPWQKASQSEIYNANSSAIEAILKDAKFECEYKGIIKDSFTDTLNAISSASNYDVIITSGGASKGDADFMAEALKELGYKAVIDSINVRPGKPTKCYKLDEKLVFILPGNPMAAFLICFLVVLPTLKKISSQKELNFTKIMAKFSGNIKFKDGRSNLVLGIYKDGKFSTINNNKFGSGMITPLVKANSIYISKVGESGLSDNDDIEIIPLY
ncbi:molybdopterin molybdotransferase MoeA [Campylobacter geochelonis]|uniref:Molybdopterin molybdenumtransferase n=1 Tax=Campylobacter geochelonis TaxID=1780362 RepID=A0A128EH01_9BACT|nr:molybdopterin molybdotransferase MoeA [Campylobacter geochelonis]QKF71301.1 molybdopterin molybdenumtransferase [Campylobacter geochelonis]CZE48175.1 molybdopterin biosynthesis enzyme [Campylobacter geochelonis]